MEECEGDVQKVSQIGGTMYEDKPITILTQNSDEITFELSQEWKTEHLDHLFVSYKPTTFGPPKCDAFEGKNATWNSGPMTAVCSKNTKLAHIEVWAADDDFDSKDDVATLPGCSCDTGDADLPIPNMVMYTFTVECESTCEEVCPIVYAPAPAPAPEAAAPVVPPCISEDSLHAVCNGTAIHAHDTITFASGEDTRIVGNIGVSPGTSITGMHEIAPGSDRLYPYQSGEFAEKIWGTDGSYNEFYKENRATAEYNLGQTASSEIGGSTFYPGTYVAKHSINFKYATVVTLDGRNDDTSQFVFQAGTTLITAADTYFVLINGAKASNVLWVLGTAATLGARSIMEGSIIAGTSITFGTMSEIRGCAIAQNAATFEARGYVNVKVHNIGDNCPNGLGQCENFGIHARATITFAGAADSVITNGDLGVAPGTSVTGNHHIEGGAREYGTLDFSNRVMFQHADLRSRRSDEHYWGVGIKQIGGSTIYPGTYRVGEAINFAAGPPVTLDGLGEDNPIWLFQGGSTFVTGADTYFILKNGAKAENIIWALGTGVTLGARSVVEGTVMAGTAVTMGTKSVINGCVIAMTAVTFETEGYINMPPFD
jgi:hypothetical protein